MRYKLDSAFAQGTNDSALIRTHCVRASEAGTEVVSEGRWFRCSWYRNEDAPDGLMLMYPAGTDVTGGRRRHFWLSMEEY